MIFLIEELKKMRQQFAESKIMEDKYIRTQEILNRKTLDLKERMKELNCLYGLSQLAIQPGISLKGIFENLLELIPPSWQYPSIVCIKIIYKEKEYTTNNFEITRWKQSAEFKLDEKNKVVIEVYYIEERPKIYEGPFLKEERSLINTIAERLGDIIKCKLLENALKDSEFKLKEHKKLLENKNIALMEVISHIEIEKDKLKENIFANIDNLLLPIITKIRVNGYSPEYTDLLEQNLKELTSSFGLKISDKNSRLTPREIEIANMIKTGLTSKEISSLLRLSIQTVEKHRVNIRNKLTITNTKTNLTSFLQHH